MSIVKANNLNLSKVSFSDVKLNKHGLKMVYVNIDGGKLLIQTPKMYAPNGIKKWEKKDNNDTDKFEMEMSFFGEDGTDKNANEIRELHNKLKELDEKIKAKILENSSKWLGIKLDKNMLETVMYNPIVKIPKDKEGNVLPYPSRLRTKIDRDNETGKFLNNKKFNTEVLFFDENKTKIDVNENNAMNVVPKGCQVINIIELVYISLSKTAISVKWKLVQSKVFKSKDAITSYAMIDDDDENENVLPDDLDSENNIVNEVETEVEENVECEVETVEENVNEVEETVEVVEEKVVKPKGRAKKV